MATVNLGSIKFKWKGTYSGATAYTIDDVVEYNGSSYICILASTGNLPTNATYFEQMSSAGTNGTNGTDLGTTLTTQGDIVYRDGSGLQRLGAGTSGQVLQTGGAGANPSWTTPATGGAISANQAALNGMQSTTSTSYVSIGSGLSVTVTPASTSSKFLILFSGTMNGGSHYLATTVFRNASNLATDVNASANTMGWSDGSTAGWEQGAWHYLDAPNTTSSITYEAKFKSGNGTSVYLGDGSPYITTLQVIEL
jgi:hypothetical protein